MQPNLKTVLSLIGAQLVAVSLLACSHAANRTVDEKLANQTAPENRKELQSETNSLIQTADISDQQRDRLIRIRDQARTQLDQEQTESLKLRSALMQEVMAQNFNADQVGVIKGRMKKLENKRLATIFKAVDDANKVLGHDNIDLRREYMHDIIRDPAEVSRATLF
jgi:Spy/CpxP family protein refolding chaperone